MTAAWPPPPPTAGPPSLRCYRHPKEEAPVACTRCDRPICSQCMISAPVGWQCPSCVKGGPPVRNMRDIGPGGVLLAERPYVTYVLMALSGIGYVLQLADPSIGRYAISAFGVAGGHLEQIVTAGFLHGGLIHIGFNMLLLLRLGGVLEARIGRLPYLSLYVASLLGGSLGELLLGDPAIPALGASGAIFGLMAATFLLPRRSRFGIEASVGGLLALNLLITFVPGLNIAIGGHIGGLLAGGLVGLVLRLIGDGRGRAGSLVVSAFAACVAIACALAATPAAEWAIRQRG